MLDQRLEWNRLLSFYMRGDLSGSVVRLDEIVDVLADAQTKLEVALDDAHRSKSAACPWPTPTHRVARP